uniref:StAR related lipid transfer domain containing 4 n=1 Tax=Cyprinus carpio carpio TaxID=630221 RepID=A0A9J8BVR3_CYPCA
CVDCAALVFFRCERDSNVLTVLRSCSSGVSVDHDEQKAGVVRGFNHPCGWFCVPAQDSEISVLTGYIQTDLRGMLPQTAVDTAMASGLVNFYSDLRQALKI